ncbi:helix-turn-helix domain-containing protein [Paenibacillus alvei]|uniref:Helix-turn-helix domain-containing protein n=1 Tax=Paenibacillus alvei TaxID=44250 RepID=A0AAP7A4N1_PAEAL|nr:helix-turn-helix domain-containing protein [Paenibacillus alvei]NOJ74165.1 helix-turn-helix domain-containing protein [Paenibacillus alvei]
MDTSLEKFPPVLDVVDIQRILGIGRRQSYELVNSGEFHTVRVGKRIKIAKDVFIRWLIGNENGLEVSTT